MKEDERKRIVEREGRMVNSKCWEGWETEELTNKSTYAFPKSMRIWETASFRLIKPLIMILR